MVPSLAHADERSGVYEQSARPRVGLELAAGLQGGKIFCESQMGQCDGFTEAGGGNLSATYMLRPTLGVGVDLWAMSHRRDDFTFTHYVNTLTVKWRPAPILTLTAGLGEAHASIDYHGVLGARSDDATAIMMEASVDLIRSQRWALYVEARFGNGFYGDSDNDGMADVTGRNVGAGAGISFFGF